MKDAWLVAVIYLAGALAKIGATSRVQLHSALADASPGPPRPEP